APEDVLRAAPDARIGEARATRTALARVRRRGLTRVVGRPELLWYPAKRLLHPAWRVRVHRTTPRAEYIVYVNAETGSVIQAYDNLAALTGRGRVFIPNPMARDHRFDPLDENGDVRGPTPESYLDVPLAGLTGNHLLDGARATTGLTRRRLKKSDHDFRVNWNRAGFEEVSAYYHVDRAIYYLEALGYKGTRRIFESPLEINARGTREDNSWYSPGERTLTFGLGDVDDAEDGETVLHEFGHALQDAICPDFGQSPEAAAMGEGFGDYFAGSFFERAKPEPYRLAVMSWDGALFDGNPPSVRRLDSSHTFETFDHSRGDHEHENGEIWSAALWQVREAVGWKKADKVIIDSHFQLDGFTTFARGARAILDADRNLHRGANEAALLRVFRGRGIGPLE
ncbi:MAG: M36 family metallopeptidase, partial [Vicinamibacterales bacterium]